MYQLINFLFAFLVSQTPNNQLINSQGKTVETRFNLPIGYQRMAVTKDSFGAYLRTFALKEDKAKVYFYNGQEKTNSQQVAVLDIDRGSKDLQQCADAVMRLRSEYLYARKQFSDISYKTFGGVAMTYDKYKNGYRINNQGFAKSKPVGYLGVDWQAEGNHYKIKNIIRGACHPSIKAIYYFGYSAKIFSV